MSEQANLLLDTERAEHNKTKHLCEIKEQRLNELQREVTGLRTKLLEYQRMEADLKSAKDDVDRIMERHRSDAAALKNEFRASQETAEQSNTTMREALLAVSAERDALQLKADKYEAVLQCTRFELDKVKADNAALQDKLSKYRHHVAVSRGIASPEPQTPPRATPNNGFTTVMTNSNNNNNNSSAIDDDALDESLLQTAEQPTQNSPTTAASPSSNHHNSVQVAGMELAEYSFILDSRTPFVRDVWKLHQQITALRRDAGRLRLNAARRRGAFTMPTDFMNEFDALNGTIGEVLKQATWIVSSYVSDVEKHYIGASPAAFPRDAQLEQQFKEQLERYDQRHLHLHPAHPHTSPRTPRSGKK
eukprot:PhM_4_TR9336/c0_g1_i1/m.76992